MNFPATRMRRLRSTAALRSLVRETHLQPSMLINPIFLCEGEGFRREISSMPGVFNLSIDEAVKEVEACAALGIGGVLLFGIPHEKDELGTGAYASDGIVQRGLRAIKATKASQSLVTVASASASTRRTATAVLLLETVNIFLSRTIRALRCSQRPPHRWPKRVPTSSHPVT
jgi:delta-aminolevulinic acid dehydratase/porphobilinogen synthase